MTAHLIELSSREIRDRMYEALAIYVEAMGYPKGTEHHRAPMWADHVLREGWRAIGAVQPGSAEASSGSGPLVGIAYGYRGSVHQWWNQQVRIGVAEAGWDQSRIEDVLGNYFELTELHVHPTAQGRGLGEAMLQALLVGRPERWVLLSTPEVPEEDNRAWRLYRRLGFRDVLRHFVFAGDHREFAVLGAELPLPRPQA